MRQSLFLLLVLGACGGGSVQTDAANATTGRVAYDFGPSEQHDVDGISVAIPNSFSVEHDGLGTFEPVEDYFVPAVTDVFRAKHSTGFVVRVDAFLQVNPNFVSRIVDWVEADCRKLEQFSREQGQVYKCEKKVLDGHVALRQISELTDGKTQWVETTFVQSQATLWTLTISGRDKPDAYPSFREFADSVLASAKFQEYSNAAKATRAVEITKQRKAEAQ